MTQNEYDKWYRELNEAQKEATDEFFAWKEKASKGKDCYADIGITRINGKAEVALREGEYISPFRGFQMSLKQNGRILSSCNWRCEDGVEKFPLLFSTKTFKSGKIAAGIFVRDGAMQMRNFIWESAITMVKAWRKITQRHSNGSKRRRSRETRMHSLW